MALVLRSTLRALVTSTLLLAACAGDELVDANGDGIDDRIVAPNNVTVVVPTQPTGFVAGQVLNAVTGEPLAAVDVTLFGGGLTGTAMTDNNGEFSFGPIAAGASFSLRFSTAGFTDATLPGLTIDDAAGNFPTSNAALFVGPVSLIPTSGTVTIQVVSTDGDPVSGAAVTVETAVRYFLRGAAVMSTVATANTDIDGLAKPAGFADVRLLSPALEAHAALVVNVAPVDMNNDGIAEFRGATVEISGRDVRTGGLPPLIVLERSNNRRLEIVASNVAGLLRPTAPPSLLAGNENIRVVFNEPVDRDTLFVDLRDEDGTTMIPAPFVLGVVGNVVSIDPAEDLAPGREYNLSIRADTPNQGAPQVLTAASPFFVRPDTNVMIAITGRFRDTNGNAAWGDGGDYIELTASIPIGRSLAAVPFRTRLWVALDLNGSGLIGDGAGELPASGQPYPGHITLNGEEPPSGNGARASGYTRHFADLPVALAIPLASTTGGFAFEVRIEPADNDGAFVADAGGRPAPQRTTGTALLQ